MKNGIRRQEVNFIQNTVTCHECGRRDIPVDSNGFIGSHARSGRKNAKRTKSYCPGSGRHVSFNGPQQQRERRRTQHR